MSSDPICRFIYLLGPTGVGKTEISLEIAKRIHWPIINCDSVQTYCHLNIGSSKPNLKKFCEIPHFLFDYVPPPKRLTAADYIKDVVSCLEENKINQTLFVGGSGFYVQALEKGLYPDSETSEEVKKEVSRWIEAGGFEFLYTWLKGRDPEFLKTVSPADHYRLRRAVEIMKARGKTITELKREMVCKNYSLLPRHVSLKLGLKMDKEDLKKRIEKRTDQMLQCGLIEEVSSLLKKGFGHWPALGSVGYREVLDFLENGGTLEDLRLKIMTSTMRLIKKQTTWFKRDRDIFWFHPDEKRGILDFVKNWLEK